MARNRGIKIVLENPNHYVNYSLKKLHQTHYYKN